MTSSAVETDPVFHVPKQENSSGLFLAFSVNSFSIEGVFVEEELQLFAKKPERSWKPPRKRAKVENDQSSGTLFRLSVKNLLIRTKLVDFSSER